MASTTLRQMLVKVLTNIGEPQLAANVPAVGQPITDSYELQVCNFINHIKEEIEQTHQWSSRWQTYTMSFVAGNTSQQIYDQGGFFLPAGAYPNSGCQVVRIFNPKFGREVALCFDITTFGIPFVLDEMPLPDLIYYNTVLNQTPVAYSTNFTVQDEGNDVILLNMYPGANSTRNIQITLYNPQGYVDPTNGIGNQVDVWNTGVSNISFNAPLSLGQTSGNLIIPWPYSNGVATVTFTGQNVVGSGAVTQTITATFAQGSTLVTNFSAPLAYNILSPTVLVTGGLSGGLGADSPLIVPSRVLEIGTSWWALEERGEELGANSMFTEERYRRALDDFAGKDQAMQGDLVMIPT
jgi:hypothetical protein